ncbi:glycosyltransferase family 2 protein [candidate division WOR-3 bacterium]|nr:glycosyltransferase family 2 protein [candidate division WOR-3 bacterium]
MISIIIPTYNEEPAIGKVIDDVKKTMDKSSYEYEIIVVDDVSKDKTRDIVRSKSIKLVEHLENKGVGRARKTGILEAKGDIIVMLDGDDSYPANRIPDLLAYLPRYDMAIGARQIEAGSKPWLRIPAKAFIRRLAEYITQKKIPDLNSGLRAFKKKIALQFFNLLPDTHSFVSTLTIALLTNAYDVKYISIDYKKRVGISTFHPIRDTTNYFLLIFRTIMYFKPLRVFLPFGLIIFIGGFIRTVYDARVLHHIKESDVIIMLTSFLIFVLGFLADLIVKLRPFKEPFGLEPSRAKPQSPQRK